MSDLALRVHDLSKCYRLHHRPEGYRTLRETLSDLVRRPRHPSCKAANPKERSCREESEILWALRNVSFEVKRGEVVGIIGRNGAGKSTLLKILSRITEPTNGWAEIHGRVGSLLEVGTGFHGELTGRENIYLSGALLGMKKAEIDRKFDEMVAFAEIEKFLDTPVKRYSSGMYLRLAFAVAAHLEPEILLVDEVLAVGDATFQKKCLGKMEDVANRGRTVLFVSHQMAAVASLCKRTILLDNGQILADGATGRLIERYLHGIFWKIVDTDLKDRSDRQGNGLVRFLGLHWETLEGERVPVLISGKDYQAVLTYECLDGRRPRNVLVSFGLRDPIRGFVLLHQTNFNHKNFANIPERGQFLCRIRRFPLAAGEYHVNLYVGSENEPYDTIADAAKVLVESGDFFGSGHPGRPDLCKVLIDCEWQIRDKGKREDSE